MTIELSVEEYFQITYQPKTRLSLEHRRVITNF